MKNILLVFLVGVLVLTGCNSSKNSTDYLDEAIELHAMEVFSDSPYRGSRTRVIDILHTKLDVQFDWQNQYLLGAAEITLKPYFYNINEVALDAKGMEILSVKIAKDGIDEELKYTYELDELRIALDRNYNRSEELKILIRYISKPEERIIQKGNAVTEDKGLYFINPLGAEEDKPQQIWTQGETEANSVWFPTIDSPNERCTHEINITVQSKFTTLSNGDLIQTVDNGDGTRTDQWAQSKPIAPYLFMMAVSEFAIVEDSLNGMKVDYYVDPEYAPYAREIFKNTPEMITQYSKQLGYEYPWSKYSQVVVHDYVSGAMENVGAVIFGNFVHQTHQEMIDGDNEETVAHELFHHWFGDVVTCESWSNLPLNESFATYGEYLWFEHKYGAMRADEHINNDLQNYLYEFQNSGPENLIRFEYNKPDDMFDSHSYAKGGRILHMLRNYVGDQAFFESLKLYLHQNEFKSVEIHQLRLAFEEVTGEDLNWFFNQWFMGKGHPELEINYAFDSTQNVQYVYVKQQQDVREFGTFILPVDIDLYVNGSVQTYNVRVDSVENIYAFKVSQQPDLVNFDAKKMLVCTKRDNHSPEEMLVMYNQGPRFMDKLEALNFAYQDSTNEKVSKEIILRAMLDDYEGIRSLAIADYDKFDPINDIKIKDVFVKTMRQDPKSSVRVEAVVALYDNYSWEEGMVDLFVEQIELDSSYMVQSELITGIAIADSTLGMKYAKKFENSDNIDVLFSVAEVYSVFGTIDNASFYDGLYSKADGYYVISFLDYYADYLLEINDVEAQKEGLNVFEKETENEETWFIRYYAVKGMVDLRELYVSKAKRAKKNGDTELAESYDQLVIRVDDFLTKRRLDEKDSRVFMGKS